MNDATPKIIRYMLGSEKPMIQKVYTKETKKIATESNWNRNLERSGIRIDHM